MSYTLKPLIETLESFLNDVESPLGESTAQVKAHEKLLIRYLKKAKIGFKIATTTHHQGRGGQSVKQSVIRLLSPLGDASKFLKSVGGKKSSEQIAGALVFSFRGKDFIYHHMTRDIAPL